MMRFNVLLESIATSTRRQELRAERAVMARMGFLDKMKELDAMIEAKRVLLKKVRTHRDTSHDFGRRTAMIFPASDTSNSSWCTRLNRLPWHTLKLEAYF